MKRACRYETENLQPFCNMDDLKKPAMKMASLATLENDLWRLDGTYDLRNGNTVNTGWWSQSLSDCDGNFTEPPVLTRSFERYFDTEAITFTFDEKGSDHPTRLMIEWYADDELTARQSFYPDSAKYLCEYPAHGTAFNRMIITFYAMNKPYRYLKLAGIDDGAEIELDDDRLTDVHICEELSLLSDELQIGTLQFDVDMSGDYEEYEFKKRQPVEVWSNTDYMGLFFITDFSSEGGYRMNISCEDYIGILDKTTFHGNMYENVPARHVISEIMGDVPFTLAGMQDEVISGYIPKCSCREALQQAAFVSGAFVITHRREDVLITKLFNRTAELSDDEVYEGAEIETAEPVTGVELTVCSFFRSIAQEEVFSGQVTAGDTLIEWDAPAWNITVTGEAEILSQSSNHVLVRTYSDRNIKVTITKYGSSKYTVSRDNSELDPGSDDNLMQITACELINPKNAGSVLARACEHIKKLRSYKCDVVSDARSGTVISLPHLYDTEGAVTGIVESCDIQLTGGKLIESVVIRLDD